MEMFILENLLNHKMLLAGISWFRQENLFKNIQILIILNFIWLFFRRIHIFFHCMYICIISRDYNSRSNLRRSVVNMWDATDRQRKTPATFYLFFHLTPWECPISSSTPLNPRVVQWEKSLNRESFSFFPLFFFTLFYLHFLYHWVHFNVTCKREKKCHFYFYEFWKNKNSINGV